MRVVLVGRRADRDRLRPRLIAAGLAIVAEAAAQPEPLPDSVDAVVLAPPPWSDAADGPANAQDPPPEPLTSREREVLALVAEGLPNKAIAATLGISDQTVKFHVAAIIAKLGAANRTDAVRLAVRRGFVVI
jgi:DNA-binding NarL/FixJ family response regulator